MATANSTTTSITRAPKGAKSAQESEGQARRAALTYHLDSNQEGGAQ
jgi:hypothetical protein